MPAPHITVYMWPDGQPIASVVMDQEDFDKLCDDIAVLEFDGKPIPKEQVDSLRAAKHLPYMTRCAQTQKFFERLNVVQNRLCAIVRGHGVAVLENLMNQTQRG